VRRRICDLRARWGARLGLALALACPRITHAAEPPLTLEQPVDRTVVRGEPAAVPIVIAPGQPWAELLCVELDGERERLVLPWSRQTSVELEPGLHRLAVVGIDRRDGSPLRSPTVQVAVLRPTEQAHAQRERNDWIIIAAFAAALAAAAALRRRPPAPSDPPIE
jgi:hypothetical protein